MCIGYVYMDGVFVWHMYMGNADSNQCVWLQVFHDGNSVIQHIESHHLITQEYVCTYKDCGKKFSNKQDLTYHLGELHNIVYESTYTCLML